MALSDREQKLLEQMERALAFEDPKLVSALRAPIGPRPSARNVGLAVLVVVAGIALLISGVMFDFAALGIIGFVAMVVGISILFTNKSHDGATKNPTGPNKPKSSKSSFMEGLEARWDNRQQGDQF